MVTSIVQARMGSRRLPGKVLADVAGRPMLKLMLDRLAFADVGRVVVATSEAPEDDAVVSVAASAGVDVIRGSEADVLSRFLAVQRAFPSDVLVRLTADCPLLDPLIVREAVARHFDTDVDYTSNTLVRTFPDGLDVEVIDAAALEAAAAEATAPEEREHVTPFIYRRPERFRLASFHHGEPLGDERWTVDTEDDLQWVRAAVEATDPLAGWEEILAVVGRQRTPPPDALALRPAADSTPRRRTWDLCRSEEVLGRVVLEVETAVGTCYVDAAPELRDVALERLREALRADYQVSELRGI